MSTVIDTLIFDRVQADVDHVSDMKHRILTHGMSSLSEAERTEYLNGLRGAYNYTDLNRVGQAVVHLAERMEVLGFDTVSVSPKTDWEVGDTPTQSQMDSYLADLQELRERVFLPESTPKVPASMDSLAYETANAIEKLLKDIADCLDRTAFEYTGLVYCGE